MPHQTTRADALLHEDLITPVHHHHEARNLLLASLPGRTPVPVTPAEADRLVATLRPTPSLADVPVAAGGPRVSRRTVLRAGGIGLGALLAASNGPRFSFAAGPADLPLLVVVFLRGGFDGLSAVVPLDDPGLRAARPTIAVDPDSTIALDQSFGMNPNLVALEPMWQAGELAWVVGAGTDGLTRSHFEDADLCERGSAPADVRSGWLGRHLATSSSAQGTFRAITVGNAAVASLTTSFQTVAMNSVASFDVAAWSKIKPQVMSLMDRLYTSAGGPAAAAAGQTLDAVGGLARLREAGTYVPDGGAVYPSSPFGKGMAQIAQLAKGQIGLEVACLDLGDWDMHAGLGSASVSSDWFSRKAADLAGALAALRTDLGDRWRSTTVVTMSEFGRRVAENGDRGLDHGTGNTMLVAGGGVSGGRVYGSLPSLTRDNLVRGDVPVTTDYRQVLSEVVSGRLGNGSNLHAVFPGFTPTTTALGLVG